MDCNIKIEEISPVLAAGGGQTDAIRVTFSVDECKEVSIEIMCGPDDGVRSTSEPFVVDTLRGGSFTQEIPLRCLCDDNGSVTVTCRDDPACSDNMKFDILCPACPAANVAKYFTDALDDTVTEQICNLGEGTVTITLVANITPPPGAASVSSYWDFGDGEFQRPVTGLQNTVLHEYATPGSYTATLIFIGHEGCEPTSIEVGPFEPCPIECPEIESLDVQVDGCAVEGDGNEVVASFSAGIRGSSSNCAYRWNFGDGFEEETASSEVSHVYSSPGIYSASLAINCGDGCWSSQGVAVIVPPCDGNTIPVYKVVFPPVELVVIVDIILPPIDDEDVDDGDGSSSGGGDGGGCFIGRLATILTAVIAIVSAALIFCFPALIKGLAVTAIVAAAIALVGGLLTYFFCKKTECNWHLLLAWQISLGAGVALLNFGSCCVTNYYSGGALLAASAAAMWYWKKRCKASSCKLYAEILFVLVTVLGPLIAALALIGEFSGCRSAEAATVTAVVTALAGLAVYNCSND